jgi:hypothetical protein
MLSSTLDTKFFSLKRLRLCSSSLRPLTRLHIISLLSCSLTLWRRRNQSFGRPDVDQRLHGLDLFVGDEIEQFAHVDEVNEARVQFLVRTCVPEGVQPVAVIYVGVAAHHLAIDAFDITLERIRET